MHTAFLQYDIVWEDKPANHGRMEAMIEAAPPPEGALLVLPELGDTGFSFDLDAIVDDETVAWAGRIARRFGIWVQAGYAVRGADGRGRNCASLIDPRGEIVGTYEKVHPFSYGREIEHFSGGDRLLLRRCGDAIVAPMICYDLRFPELWRLAAAAGAEVFTIGASWPAPRQHHWRALLIARAVENQAYVVAANRIGADPHLPYAGGSIIVSPSGEVLAEAAADAALLAADLDLDALRAWRRDFPALRDIRRDLLGTVTIDGPIDERADTAPKHAAG